ncbi:hypothetical protein OAE97_01130, partial [Verrucomicrobia bacterium]|nr:hypothetical protein [Verrucomicrobiota bacterium]
MPNQTSSKRPLRFSRLCSWQAMLPHTWLRFLARSFILIIMAILPAACSTGRYEMSANREAASLIAE